MTLTAIPSAATTTNTNTARPFPQGMGRGKGDVTPTDSTTPDFTCDSRPATHDSASSSHPATSPLGYSATSSDPPTTRRSDDLTPSAPTPFSPSDAAVSDILQSLTNPYCSFHSIAEQHKISIEALALWLSRPDIRERTRTYRSAAALHIQMTAERELPIAVDGLVKSVDDAIFEQSRFAWHPMSATWAQIEQRRRARETLRKNVRLLLQLSKYRPLDPFNPPPPARPAPSSAPRGGGAESSRRRGFDAPDSIKAADPATPSPRAREFSAPSTERSEPRSTSSSPPTSVPLVLSDLSVANNGANGHHRTNGHPPRAAPRFTPLTIKLTPVSRLTARAGASPARPGPPCFSRLASHVPPPPPSCPPENRAPPAQNSDSGPLESRQLVTWYPPP